MQDFAYRFDAHREELVQRWNVVVYILFPLRKYLSAVFLIWQVKLTRLRNLGWLLTCETELYCNNNRILVFFDSFSQNRITQILSDFLPDDLMLFIQLLNHKNIPRITIGI